MEKTRRTAKGELSVLFGEKALPVDTFFRQINLRGLAKESWEMDRLPAETRGQLQAYANGVNDYVQGVSLTESESQTGRVLPAEFIAFGITQETFEPWTPADTLMCAKFMSFAVSYDWGPTLHREALRQTHPDLEFFMEDIYSFSADMMGDMVPIVDDDDLKEWGHYSEKTLTQRYRESADRVKASQPPLPEDRASTQYSEKVQSYKMKLSEYMGGDSPLLNDG